jgi:hypothetical protein
VTDPVCPSCGEAEQLTGTPLDGGIEITCGACGTRWNRTERRCRACGGGESTVVRQRMTTYPRGNQLAVIGMRDVPLCPQCDGGAVSRLGPGRLLEDGYRSRFVSGAPDDSASTTPATPATRARSRIQPPAPPVATPAAARRPKSPTDPTVRKAVEAYLAHGTDAVSAAAMLVIGRALGTSTRLSDLTAADAGPRLDEAIEEQWPRRSAIRTLAVDAVNDAFRFWVSRGWISADQAPPALPRG